MVMHTGRQSCRTPLRATATDETLRYAVLGEDVPSGPAQHAWAGYWAHHTSLRAHESGPALEAELAARGSLISAWLQTWSAWTRHA